MNEDKEKVFLRTFGCQMNVRDSEVIAGLLTKQGYKITGREEAADIIIYNTCSVRKHAEDKVWSELGRWGTRPKKKIIGLVGCMAKNYRDEVFRRAPGVDFAVGPGDIAKIPKIIERLSQDSFFERKIWETDGSIRPEEIYHTGFYEDKKHGYVVISEGCSNFCSYCVVPYVRGVLRNRDYRNILAEIERAVKKGITNITLLGQNVNAYESIDAQAPKARGKKIGFMDLLKMVNAIKGLKEFSFITSHPKDASLKLFKAMAECNKLKKYLHLPIQSGSDNVLERMGRGYTRKSYLNLVDNYRKIVKDGALSTDIIVGFPGEAEDDFRDTYNLIKDVEFDSAYIFKYSIRPHTRAEALPDDVPKKEKERRHQLILNLQKDISKRKRAKNKA
ncbi:tRNA (N6-isopentenyl adenosine(37)-C2)-methylthiotransferase MiaB [Candidatus Omnitrophota bacterium]